MAAPASKNATGDGTIAEQAVFVKSVDIPEHVTKINGYDFNKGIDYEALLDSFASTGFQASYFADAVTVVNTMLDERAKPVELDEDADKYFPYPAGKLRGSLTLFLGYTSNLVSSGLRDVIRYVVQHNHVDCLVTTAGGIEEDLIKCLKPSYLGDFKLDGAGLRAKGLNRAGNVLIPNDNYCAFEDWITPILEQCLEEQETGGVRWTPSKLIRRLGERIDDQTSILYWAARNNIPVFSPALTDGSIGDMLFFFSLKHDPSIRLDIVEDVKHINMLAMRSVRTGSLILGGGVVKHHVNNANLMRNGSDHTVYINTAHEFDGSDSGASPDEAVSWGKVRAGSAPVKVCADATLIFPLLVAKTFAKRASRTAEENDKW